MFDSIDPKARMLWRASRIHIENQITENRKRSSVFGYRTWLRPYFFHVINFIVRLSGLRSRGKRNARDFCVPSVDFSFPDLPSAFDGYEILHLSDLHIGDIDNLSGMIGERFSAINPDLVVITGDFQTHGAPSAKKTADLMSHLILNIKSRDGWVAVLGNHDRHDMLDALEAIDVRVLANESVVIYRGKNKLRLVGIDDVHAFYSPDAITAMENHQESFRIILVHTVDLATVAARLGYSLYLSGHTHGGQICLPNGRALLTALDSHRDLATGSWKLNGMHGYTSRGLGHGTVPFRFNCPGEATLIRLNKD